MRGDGADAVWLCAGASHASILARYNNLGRHQAELAEYIGQKAATDELMKTYVEVIG